MDEGNQIFILPAQVNTGSNPLYPAGMTDGYSVIGAGTPGAERAAAQTAPAKRMDLSDPKVKGLAGLLVVALIAAICYGGALYSFQQKLEQNWSRVEGEDDFYYTLGLDIEDGNIHYYMEGYFEVYDISDIEYRVTTPGSIEVDYGGGTTETIEVEFNDEGSMMTFRPSLTDSSSVEHWFNH